VTHDPFCPQAQMYQDNAVSWWDSECQEDFDCRCDLIAKIRGDELRRPSEDGWMSVRAVLAWEDQVRADERQRIIGVMEQNSDGDVMKVIQAVLDMI